MEFLRLDSDGGNRFFRRNRFLLLKDIIEQTIADKKVCCILDVGGLPNYWLSYGAELDWNRIKVFLLNLPNHAERFYPMLDVCFASRRPELTSIAGDARDMKDYKDLSFDIVHSNSVIEHVGNWSDMAAMASEVRRLAPRYFIQTPYFWFPIEPHARLPVFHWMPESWRYRIVLRRKCGFMAWASNTDVGTAMTAVQNATLLDRRQMQFLFPDAKIVSERFLGFTKSLIAVR
jgi:hypothetical protein